MPSGVSSTDRVNVPSCAAGSAARVTVMTSLRVGSIGGSTHGCSAVGAQDGWPATSIELTVTPGGVVTANGNGGDGCPPLLVAVSVRVPVPPAVGARGDLRGRQDQVVGRQRRPDPQRNPVAVGDRHAAVAGQVGEQRQRAHRNRRADVDAEAGDHRSGAVDDGDAPSGGPGVGSLLG